MELLIEFLLSLILEGSMEAARSKRTPKWVRYPLIVLLSLLIVAMLGGVAVFGVWLLLRKRESYGVAFGCLLLLLDGIMIVSAVIKIRKQLRRRASEKAKEKV